jgi:hypothetical protein
MSRRMLPKISFVPSKIDRSGREENRADVDADSDVHVTAQFVITSHARLAGPNLLRPWDLSPPSRPASMCGPLFKLKDTSHSWEVFQ